MIINKSGLTIRLAVSSLRVMGRATQGVRLITLRGEDSIAAVAKVEVEVNEEINDILDENVDFIEDDSNNDSSSE
jgi:DNA gyrase subunit A